MRIIILFLNLNVPNLGTKITKINIEHPIRNAQVKKQELGAWSRGRRAWI